MSKNINICLILFVLSANLGNSGSAGSAPTNIDGNPLAPQVTNGPYVISQDSISDKVILVPNRGYPGFKDRYEALRTRTLPQQVSYYVLDFGENYNFPHIDLYEPPFASTAVGWLDRATEKISRADPPMGCHLILRQGAEDQHLAARRKFRSFVQGTVARAKITGVVPLASISRDADSLDLQAARGSDGVSHGRPEDARQENDRNIGTRIVVRHPPLQAGSPSLELVGKLVQVLKEAQDSVKTLNRETLAPIQVLPSGNERDSTTDDVSYSLVCLHHLAPDPEHRLTSATQRIVDRTVRESVKASIDAARKLWRPDERITRLSEVEDDLMDRGIIIPLVQPVTTIRVARELAHPGVNAGPQLPSKFLRCRDR